MDIRGRYSMPSDKFKSHEYMQRDEPEEPSREEVYGVNRLKYGYEGKHVKGMIPRQDEDDELANIVEGYDDAED